MARRILLVRHGQDEDNAEGLLNGHRDRPLTDLGKRQAGEVSAKLAELGYEVDVVIASPLQRANNTAAAVHAALKVQTPLLTWDEMKERDFGILSGRPLTDIPVVAGDKVMVTDKVTYFLEVEGCETFPTLLQRADGVLARVNKEFSGQTVVLVGHGDINKMVRAAFLGWTWEEGLRTAYVGNTNIIELPPPAGEATAARSLLSGVEQT
eukprot:Hpha_TRINITY_DN16516_c1_g14::TRINITY_DN16516_c1_g14_i1::g.136819::m.136819/K15634/gpmB; probable phosphoglycerate mutase